MAHTSLKPDPSIVRGMELFAGLDAAGLEDVIAMAHTRRVAKGEQIFAQGQTCDTCHALIDGRVKIQQTGADGGQAVLRFIGPGDMFGTLAMFMQGGYPADAVAVLDCVEITWSVETMNRLMRRHPDIAMNALRLLGERLQEMQVRVRELSTARVERRVAAALLRLTRQAGRRVEGGVEIDFPLSRQDLAEMTGTTLHTVSRIMSAWEEQGLVESGRQKVIIRKPHQLVALAEDLPPAPAGSPEKPAG
ncbi:MAG TPA: Crp/Fnr family transcriptional regulator [Azospirillaceae bacterium]|nr:Crp/Fnr family transcriptional regulator [Azospirillaceae bacterium]